MVRICEKLFPKGSRPYQKKAGFEIDGILKDQLDILLKNIKEDWDFTIIISGGGEVRVGKSVLAIQIGYYWNHMIEKLYRKKAPFDVKNNIVFDGKKLIEKGNYLGQNYSFPVLIYDEAGAELEGKKIMTAVTQNVLDFYRECGQYNLLNIIVLPDYFDLPKGIALSRSIFLIDVSYISTSEGIFKRGYFKFYSRRNKKHLFLKGKRDLNYNAHPHNFNGRFDKFYPINEKEYRAAKQEALSKRESKRRNKFQMQRDACWYLLNKEFNKTQEWVAKRMEQLTGIFVAQQTINDGLRHYVMENE